MTARDTGAQYRASVLNASQQAAGFIRANSVAFADFVAGLIAGPAPKAKVSKLAPKRRAKK